MEKNDREAERREEIINAIIKDPDFQKEWMETKRKGEENKKDPKNLGKAILMGLVGTALIVIGIIVTIFGINEIMNLLG